MNEWARWLTSEGYVALVLDSFTPRGVTNVCGTGRGPTTLDADADAFGALRYLRSLPFVDGERVGSGRRSGLPGSMARTSRP